MKRRDGRLGTCKRQPQLIGGEAPLHQCRRDYGTRQLRIKDRGGPLMKAMFLDLSGINIGSLESAIPKNRLFSRSRRDRPTVVVLQTSFLFECPLAKKGRQDSKKNLFRSNDTRPVMHLFWKYWEEKVDSVEQSNEKYLKGYYPKIQINTWQPICSVVNSNSWYHKGIVASVENRPEGRQRPVQCISFMGVKKTWTEWYV